MSKIDEMAVKMIDLYRKENPKEERFLEVVVQVRDVGDHYRLALGARDMARARSLKGLRVTSVTPVAVAGLPHYVMGYHQVLKKDKIEHKETSRVGAFRIRLSSGDEIITAKTFYGSQGGLLEVTCAPKASLKKLLRATNEYVKYSQRLRCGTFKASMTPTGLQYEAIEVGEVPVSHEALGAVRREKEFFFDNVALFTRMGRPGVRKVMLVGPYGTGKSSICKEIAREAAGTMPVVFATDLSSAAEHLRLAARQKRASILFIEDAESVLSAYDERSKSYILNFLDGVDQPVNPAGTFIVFTTNYPEQIEDRIKKRHGRIDKLIQVGELRGRYALEAAHLYLPGEYADLSDEALLELVEGLTGAQIMELMQASIMAAVSKKEKKVSAFRIRATRKVMQEDFENVDKYAAVKTTLSRRATGFHHESLSNGHEEF